jgi:hypothetical protein
LLYKSVPIPIPEHMNFIYFYTVMYFFKFVEILIAVFDGKNAFGAPRYGMVAQRLITNSLITLMPCIASVSNFQFSITKSQWYDYLRYICSIIFRASVICFV